jgi:hypothetical protein
LSDQLEQKTLILSLYNSTIKKKIAKIFLHLKLFTNEEQILDEFHQHYLFKIIKEHWELFKTELPRKKFQDFFPNKIKKEYSFLENVVCFTFDFKYTSKCLVLQRNFLKQTQSLYILLFLKRNKISIPRKLIQLILES